MTEQELLYKQLVEDGYDQDTAADMARDLINESQGVWF